MIITKTPYRISFFGGGSDHPEWFLNNGGAVLSTSINRYCYISCRHLPRFFEHKHRFVYSEIENISDVAEIKHPAIKGVFEWFNWTTGMELHHDGDLPARSGLGSSSAFTVGMINALFAMRGIRKSKYELAKESIHVEKNVIREAVGYQDQIAVTYGGFNRIDFLRNGDFVVNPMIMPPERLQDFESSWMLFFTGQSRIAAAIEESKIKNLGLNAAAMDKIMNSVDEACEILSNPLRSLDEIGSLINEAWQYKKSLSKNVTSELIDSTYKLAISAGALGGKILGAGGGGFLIFYVPSEKRNSVRRALSAFLEVPFRFENEGSSVSIYQPAEVY